MSRGLRAVPILLSACVLWAGPVVAQDLDRDGLSDRLEQALLERFAPTLVLSAGECDGQPATLEPWAAIRASSIAAARSMATSRFAPLRPGDVEIEIKYFHLWGRDCGRPSHALDIERVSTLVRAARLDAAPEEWQAAYWYAAAHEGTVCDASSGAAAQAVRATTVGPYVYVSRGKHASYLNRGHCKWGCGSDRCDPGPPAPRGDVLNLGERDAPMNGATWLVSRRWDLADKLDHGLRRGAARALRPRMALDRPGPAGGPPPDPGADPGRRHRARRPHRGRKSCYPLARCRRRRHGDGRRGHRSGHRDGRREDVEGIAWFLRVK